MDQNEGPWDYLQKPKGARGKPLQPREPVKVVLRLSWDNPGKWGEFHAMQLGRSPRKIELPACQSIDRSINIASGGGGAVTSGFPEDQFGREEEGVVEEVEPLFEASSVRGRMIWWLLVLTSGDCFALHNNGLIALGPLTPGTRVAYRVAGGGRTIEGYSRLAHIRRVDGDEETFAGRMMKLVRGGP